jgi:alanine-glyoxylate transaminase / serine-glyoxylate transaminase / serine-pyruvate transaminase
MTLCSWSTRSRHWDAYRSRWTHGGVDVAMSGSQKGLMSPPGLGFVVVNGRARSAHKRAGLRHRIGTGLHGAAKCTTRNTQALRLSICFSRYAALDMIFAEGLNEVFRRHRLLAEAVRRAVTEWAKGKAFDFNITSDTVTTILMAEGRHPGPLQGCCNAKCGVVLGAGFGEMARKAFRIAHIGRVNAPMVLGTLGVVEMGLKALGIPHGSEGVRAAIAWLGKRVTS